MSRSVALSLLGVATSCATAKPAQSPLVEPQVAATSQTRRVAPQDVITEVAAGRSSTCVRTKQGRIACWGDGLSLERGRRAPSWEPLLFPVPPASSIVGGDETWCASTRDTGEVWCWGSNGRGALGRPTASGFDMRPGPVVRVNDAVDLVHRAGKTCARTEAGVVWCWGDQRPPTRIGTTAYIGPLVLNGSGELCTQHPLRCDADDLSNPFERQWGFTTDWYASTELLEHCSLAEDGSGSCVQSGPYRASLSLPLTQPGSWSVGESHVCGLGMDGLAWCVGDDSSAQLGELDSLGPVRSISTGARHSCALTESREVMCWGDNEYGQVGLPIRARPGDAPVKASLEPVARGLVRFGDDICVETDAGIFCPSKRCEAPGFEATEFEQALVGPHGKTCLYSPSGPAACAHKYEVERMTRAELSEVEQLARRPDFGRWCLAKGRLSPCNTEERLETDGSLSSVSTDGNDACGLTARGDLRCYFVSSRKMHTFSGPFDEVSMPEAYARRSEGAYVWIDTEEARLRPMPVPNLVDVSSEGINDACGVDESGVAWCWTLRREPKPQRIDAPVPFSKIETTSQHACAIGGDGSLWCWGDNDRGQLGWGEARCSRAPVNLTERILRSLEEAEDSR